MTRDEFLNPLVLVGAALMFFSGPQVALSQEQPLTPEEQKAADMRIPELDRTALEPEEREPITVSPEERNPFGLIGGAEVPAEAGVPVTESEEQKLRRILGAMRVSGLSGAPGSYRVLIGTIAAKQGEVLPRFFTNQAEVLTVSDISDRQVTLAFVEADSNRPARTIEFGIDLKPRVRSVLAGEVFGEAVPFNADGSLNLPPLESKDVNGILEREKTGGMQSLVDRDMQFMGEAVSRRPEAKASDEKPPEQ